MTTLRIERQGRTNSRSWRSVGLRVLAVAGFATAAWLLSGSAAQADTNTQPNDAKAPSTGSVVAPLGGLISSVSSPVLAATSGILESGSAVVQPVSGVTKQVVPTLTKTTQAVVSVVTDAPGSAGKASILSPLTDVVSPVTDVLRPMTGTVTHATGLDKVLPSGEQQQETSVDSETVESPSTAGGGVVSSDLPTSSRPSGSLEDSGTEQVSAGTASDMSSPAVSRNDLPLPAPSGPITGTTGSTGSLSVSHQDSGSLALVPAHVTHSTLPSSSLPVTTFIGNSRNSAADPMVSPD